MNYKNSIDYPSFEEMLKSVTLPPNKPKDMVLHTGMKGAALFNEALEAEAEFQLALSELNDLLKFKILTKEECDNLDEMLNCKDPESITLAITIIKTNTQTHINKTRNGRTTI